MLGATPSRRKFTTGVALAAAGVTLRALGATARPERTRLTLAVGGKAALYHLPLTIAEQRGFFRAEGLNVTLQNIPEGPQAAQAALADGAAVVGGAYEEVIQLHGQGLPLRAFVFQGRAPQVVLGVSTRNLPGFRSTAELRGRRIGVMSSGSGSHMIASLVLARAGLRPGDVGFVAAPTAAQVLAALHGGQIGAVCHTDPVMTLLEQRGEVRIVSDTRTLRGTLDLLGGPMPGGCLYATADFVQQNPNTVQGLTNGIVRALKWLQTAGPQDLIRTVPGHYLLGDQALYLASFNRVREAISLDGLAPDEGPGTALRVVAGFGLPARRRPIELARTYTNHFALQAKERFRA